MRLVPLFHFSPDLNFYDINLKYLNLSDLSTSQTFQTSQPLKPFRPLNLSNLFNLSTPAHLLNGMVSGAGGDGHKSERGILGTGGSHTRSVCYEHVLAVMQLIPAVEQRCFRIEAHAYAAHLVYISAR